MLFDSVSLISLRVGALGLCVSVTQFANELGSWTLNQIATLFSRTVRLRIYRDLGRLRHWQNDCRAAPQLRESQ